MDKECDICFKIICRKCSWEPDQQEVAAIQKGFLTACPMCGWIPGSAVL